MITWGGQMTNRISMSAIAIAVAAAYAVPVKAQSTGEGASRLDEITVTARRREETALEVPLSLSAFDAQAIENAAIFNVDDIARLTPGLSFTEQGNIWPGRLYSQIFFRGMTVINPTPKDQIGAVFIDGIYYLGAASSINTFDVERVEVLKGPQNAFFGRNTFGGAVNFITKTPEGPQRTNVETDFTARGSFKASLANEGTLVDDKLLYRVSVSKYRRAPHYTANDGGDLGEQESTNLALTLYATPTERLSMRARFAYGEDNDGVATNAFLNGTDYNTCGGTTPVSRLSDTGQPVTLFPNNFICGKIPNVGAVGTQAISRNTSLRSPVLTAQGRGNLLRDVTQDKNFEQYVPTADPRIVGIARRLFDKVPDLDGLGMRRDYYLTSLSADYQLTDALTVSGVFGYNRAETFEANAIDGQDLEIQYQWNANISTDRSAELRLGWDNGGKLSGMVGLSYYEQVYEGSFTGVMAVRPLANGPLGISGNAGGTEGEVVGGFGALYYDLANDITLTLEGRYQTDKVINTGNLLVPEDISFTDFLPRAIVSWVPEGRNLNIYGSYSKGAIPGVFNNSLTDPTIPQAERDRIAAQSGASLVLDSESLDSYELGWKQRFAGGRGYVNAAAYYMEWRGQKLLASIPVTLVDGSVVSRAFQLPADVNIYGLELDGGFAPTDWLSLDATLNWTDSEYQKGLDNNAGLVSGSRNITGLTVTRFPEWSGSLAASVSGDVNAEWSWYSRLDVLYTGKQFIDPSNLAYIDEYVTMNIRGGVRSDQWRIEGYIRNLTNDDTWINGARLTDLRAFANSGASMTPPQKREIGVRVSVGF
jgi:iron complex outermembrane recepter protein